MEAKVTWKNGMSFTGTANSGFELPLGTDPSVGGANDGFRPLELMAVSLAGCTAMDVISILRKKQQDITDFQVETHADQQSDHPHVFTHLVVTYHVTGHGIDEKSVLRAMELSATKYCPAQAMLGKIAPMELKYVIYEGDSSQARTQVASGELVLAQ
jgi:putative redox protein